MCRVGFALLYLLDFFRGDNTGKIALKGLDHVLVFTVADSVISVRHYSIMLKRSGSQASSCDSVA
jgi:hypothetical protein